MYADADIALAVQATDMRVLRADLTRPDPRLDDYLRAFGGAGLPFAVILKPEGQVHRTLPDLFTEVGPGEPIQVYSGRALLHAALADRFKSKSLEVTARVQACNDTGRCLPPSTLSADVLGPSDSVAR